jgi:uncharacterized membrane protein YoaK (UPF0700 family)
MSSRLALGLVKASVDDNEMTRSCATAVRQRAGLVVVLALTSGATDAIGFLALGSAFTSVMTGNMVLLGVGAADQDLALVLSCTVAIVSFVVGAAIGARVAGNPAAGDSVWPSAVTVALYIELALLLVFAACWWAVDSAPSQTWLLPMLGLNAAALGLQSSAIQRFGVSGLSTTYLTGTLTTVVIKLIGGHGLRKVSHSMTILFGLILGAAVGTVLVKFAPVAVPSVQLLTLGSVLLMVHLSRHLHITKE